MTGQPERIKVFLSYARADAGLAERVETALAAAGFDVWRDVRRIKGTDVWAHTIDQALRECDRMVVLLSKASMASKEVFPEWFFFYQHRKPLHCVLIETCEIDYHLLPYNYVDARELFDAAANRLAKDLRQAFTAPFFGADAIVVSPHAPAGTLEDTMQAALAMLTGPDAGRNAMAITPDMARRIEEHPPRTMAEYRLGRVAAWCGPRYQLDERFVHLSLLVDQGEDAPQRFTQVRRFTDLRSALREQIEPALVVLGAPGAGKSTLLRRLELTTALNGLRDDTEKVTLYASLAEYRADVEGAAPPTPLDWLATRWKRRYPALPPVADLLDDRRVLLLLDALNEMPHNSPEEYRDRVGRWRAFVQQYVRDLPGNRAVLACRSLDYSAPLSTREMPVPQVRVEPMDDAQVRDFLRIYLLSEPDADAAWNQLAADRGRLDLFRAPYYLKMLTEQIMDGGRIPEGRARLFSGFVRRLLRRESDHPLLQPGRLFTEFDRERLFDADAAYRNPTYIPDDGLLIPALTALAYGMQVVRDALEQNQVRIPRKQSFESMSVPADAGADVVRVGCSLALLDHDRAFDQIMYHHQLLQEFFAARQLAFTPDATKWRVEWREGLAAKVPPLSDYEPLPPLPGTGWEETTVIAAGLATDADAFVRLVLAENSPLAARCAASSEAGVSDRLKDHVRSKLLGRMVDKQSDLRARIAAGLALGNVGDPRFERRTGPHGDYLFPPMATIPPGTYPIGGDKYDDEEPTHKASIEAFRIAVFPVTNAEYARFIESGGYEDERWWDTEVSRAWRLGKGSTEGQRQTERDNRKLFQSWTEEYIRGRVRENRITSKQADDWITIRNWTEGEFEGWLDELYPSGRRYTAPAYWHDDVFNNPSQPVVGVCWHEARAYCVWLSAQAAGVFRLPTEVEFESSARGLAGREYAYGAEFDSRRCNTFESHIRRSTPVGIFDNATPEGVHDLSGNVWEWTCSLYRPYPYDAADGREDAGADGRRVLRGGSWGFNQDDARAAFRGSSYPVYRSSGVGFRLASPAKNL